MVGLALKSDLDSVERVLDVFANNAGDLDKEEQLAHEDEWRS